MIKRIIGLSLFGVLATATYGAFKFNKFAQKELLKRTFEAGRKTGYDQGLKDSIHNTIKEYIEEKYKTIVHK